MSDRPMVEFVCDNCKKKVVISGVEIGIYGMPIPVGWFKIEAHYGSNCESVDQDPEYSTRRGVSELTIVDACCFECISGALLKAEDE